MARFLPASVERVKDAADIVEIVSAHTDLRRAGARFVGLCPFHEERTPSFSVDPAQKLYYCFGCEAGGDVFRFVQEKEGLGFPEAVEALAERFGVELEREAEDPRAEERRRQRARLHEALERTASFYERYLWDSGEAERAREYLKGRGLGEEVLRSFGVGYAPSAWDRVLTAGQRAGFSVEELAAAGLVQPGRRGGHYDRFRARITFPVRDQRGRVLGFGARALERGGGGGGRERTGSEGGGRGERRSGGPKYLNSPEGDLFHKGRVLYGIDRARAAIAKAGRAVLVEGYTDVLALHQDGVEEAVAVMGTALTTEQLALVSGLAPSVVLALDADRAGTDAMVRAQRLAAGREVTIRVAAMPDDADPADMLAAGRGEELRGLLADAVDLPTFRVETALARGDLRSGAGRERALGEVVPVLAAMGDAVGRDELVRRVASGLDTEPSLVARRVQAAELAGDRGADVHAGGGAASGGGEQVEADRTPGAERPAAPSPRQLRERALLAMCVAEPGLGGGYLKRLSAEHLSGALAARALEWLRGHLEEPLAGLPREDEQLVSLVTHLVMRAEREPASEEAMELNFLLLEQRRLEDRIAVAREAGDDAEAASLSRERAGLVDRISRAERHAA